MEVTYTRGKPGELDEIRDFANMAFSMHTRPHDFARMLPKLYADGSATEGEHYLVREDGRLVAAVCAHPFTLACRDRTLPCAAIGSVSVHPYVRGKGYMRKLMTTAVADMAQNGIALSVLDGRRHRYAYFGYEPAGLRAEYNITPDNLRHMASAHKLALAAAPVLAGRIAVTRSAEVEALCRAEGFPVLRHAEPRRSDTVRLGLTALLAQQPDLQGCVFLPGDQPRLTRQTLEALAVGAAPDTIRRPAAPDGTPGSPVLFGRDYFAALLHLPEGSGGSAVLRAHPQAIRLLPTPAAELRDIDTRSDLEALRGGKEQMPHF